MSHDPEQRPVQILALISRTLPRDYAGQILQCIEHAGGIPLVYWGVIPKTDKGVTNTVLLQVERELPCCRAILLVARTALDLQSADECFPNVIEQIVVRNPRAKILRYVFVSDLPPKALLDRSIVGVTSEENLTNSITEALSCITR